jgi:hypothetical protein
MGPLSPDERHEHLVRPPEPTTTDTMSSASPHPHLTLTSPSSTSPTLPRPCLVWQVLQIGRGLPEEGTGPRHHSMPGCQGLPQGTHLHPSCIDTDRHPNTIQCHGAKAHGWKSRTLITSHPIPPSNRPIPSPTSGGQGRPAPLHDPLGRARAQAPSERRRLPVRDWPSIPRPLGCPPAVCLLLAGPLLTQSLMDQHSPPQRLVHGVAARRRRDRIWRQGRRRVISPSLAGTTYEVLGSYGVEIWRDMARCASRSRDGRDVAGEARTRRVRIAPRSRAAAAR